MAALNGFRPPDLNARILELLELVGLADALKKRVGEFSKGMQQRLGLAQALIHDPELVLLDEPTDGLDPVGRKEVRDILHSLRSARKTVFLNSHLLSEIELICDDLVVMKKGKIARRGKPADFTRATGEYRIRISGTEEIARRASAFFVGSHSKDRDLFVQPRDVRELNSIIDRLRDDALEIEVVEPIRSTMEEAFLSIVSSEGQA
jgi:ABC-2 type transport system ATP-binding protein